MPGSSPSDPWRPPQGYLDAAAGQPLTQSTLDAWVRGQRQGWSDPGGLHGPARQASLLLDAARASLASSLSACAPDRPISPEQVWLASSAASARDGLLAGFPGPIVTSAVDTVPILDLADARPGSQVIGVDAAGRIDAGAAGSACASVPRGVLCLQFANAEVGTLQPVIPRPPQVPWVADATGCIGRILLPEGWAALWAPAHDWAGPTGLGIAVIRDGQGWHRPTHASRGWLDGSPDVPAAVAAAIALEEVAGAWSEEADRAARLVDRLREQVPARVPEVEVVGDPLHRLPHTLTFSVLYVPGEALVSELDRSGFAVASGSACVAPERRPSHVLAAMGAYTGGNVRITLPFGCTQETIDGFLDALPPIVQRLREEVGR